MKKIISLTIAVLMLVAMLAGCGNSAPAATDAASASSAKEYTVDYYQLGYETGKMAASVLLEGKSPADIEVMTLTPAVAYNEELCAQLGIEVK